jgi:hypothetical protein
MQKLKNMKLALMVITKESEDWAMKYEKFAKEKDGELQAVVLERQWEDNHVKLTHFQGEVVIVNEENLEKYERNSATLSILGWWLCTKGRKHTKVS